METENVLGGYYYGSTPPLVNLNVNGGVVSDVTPDAGHAYNPLGPVVLSSGTLISSGDGGPWHGYQFTGQITATNSAASFINGVGTDPGSTLGGPTTVEVDAGSTLTINSPLYNATQPSVPVVSSLTQTGSGLLVLNANEAYTGGTTVSGGTLELSNQSGFASGITNNAMIQVDNSSGTPWSLSTTIPAAADC